MKLKSFSLPEPSAIRTTCRYEGLRLRHMQKPIIKIPTINMIIPNATPRASGRAMPPLTVTNMVIDGPDTTSPPAFVTCA